MSADDKVSSGYKYFWSALETQEQELKAFLAKYKPSIVQNDGTKPWIWVQGSQKEQEDSGVDEATAEASDLLKEYTEKVEAIKNDESIPVRANKKTGKKSKKEVREEVQAEATTKLKEVALKHGYLTGKWLVFAPSDRVDALWGSIANSLVSGPLSETDAYCAKVSTSPQGHNESSNTQHIICIYLPNVYDKEKVTEVMKVLLRSHGVSLSGAKSNLYTAIHLDSKHPSGIPSTIWKNNAILPDVEAKQLRDAYFTSLKEKDGRDKAAVDDPVTTVAKTEAAPKKGSKPNLKLKKKKNDDPFGSDDEQEGGEVAKKPPPSNPKPAPKAAPKAKPQLKKKVQDDDGFASSEDEAEKKSSSKPPSTKGAAKAKPRTTRKRGNVEAEDEGEDNDDEDYESGSEPKSKKARR